MKIKIITCHDVYNNGASLQAYALQTFLESYGHNVEIINYKPQYLSNHFKLLYVDNPKWRTNIIKKIIYLICKFPMKMLSLKKKNAFDKFRFKYLNVTADTYKTNKELKGNTPIADIYIAGSDQIWNTRFPNGRDAAFYLDFAPESSRRISYAASFATDSIDAKYSSFIKEKLAYLDAVSVREHSAVEIVREHGVYAAEWVCDPVFLINTIDWEPLVAENKSNDKYILVYDFDSNSVIESIAKNLSIKNNWKIYAVNKKLSYADKNHPYAGPSEFLALIKNAEYVISNSFHGSAFSIIFRRNFLVIPRVEAINTRMKSLLSLAGIDDRLVTHLAEVPTTEIDYHQVDMNFNAFIENSKEYLLNNIK